MRSLSNPLARRVVGAAIATVAVVGIVVTQSPAFAASDDKEIVVNDQPVEGDDLARAQEPLVAAATAITALDRGREALGGIRLQVKEGVVEVYWKGEVPDPVRKEIETQQANGVRVDLRPADYSGAELDAAIHQIMDDRERYPGLAVIAPRSEASGLQGYFTDPRAARRFRFSLPVTIEAAPEGTIPFARNNDTSPFWGGAAARIGGAGCTTGFAVIQGFPGAEFSRGVLSAGHCNPSGGSTWTTPTGLTIGTAGARNWISDSIYVRGRSSGRVYTGGITSGTSKMVIAPTPNFPGQFVCTEGSATGEHCLVLNYFVGAAALVAGAPAFGVTLAFNITGAIAGGSGDSGGPVIVSYNPVAALAAGLISFGIGGSPCPTGTCSSLIGYIDINWVLATNFPMFLAP